MRQWKIVSSWSTLSCWVIAERRKEAHFHVHAHGKREGPKLSESIEAWSLGAPQRVHRGRCVWDCIVTGESIETAGLCGPLPWWEWGEDYTHTNLKMIVQESWGVGGLRGSNIIILVVSHLRHILLISATSDHANSVFCWMLASRKNNYKSSKVQISSNDGTYIFQNSRFVKNEISKHMLF